MNILTFDIGGTSIKYAVVTDKGEISNRGSYKTPLKDKDEFYKELLKRVEEYNNQIDGIALSSPGIINAKDGVIELIFAIPFLQGINIKSELEELTGKRVTIENDGKCAALAEVWQGAGREFNDQVFVVIGTGIGGAIVKDRKIHHGANLACGELGMMLLGTKDGSYKNWSSIASTINLVSRAEEALEVEKGSLDGHRVFEMAQEGNELVKVEVEKFYENIALGLYNLQFSYDPQAIIIGGGISARENLVENIERHLKIFNDKHGSLGNNLVIKRCEFLNDANLIGAVSHYLEG